ARELDAGAAARVREVALLESLPHRHRQPPADVGVDQRRLGFGDPCEDVGLLEVLALERGSLCLVELAEQVARQVRVCGAHLPSISGGIGRPYGPPPVITYAAAR